MKTTPFEVEPLLSERAQAAYCLGLDRLRLAMDSATLRAMVWNRSQPSSLRHHETRNDVATWESAASLTGPFCIEGRGYGRCEDPTE